MRHIILLLCGFLTIFSVTAQTQIEAKDVKQSALFRIPTDAQIAAWNKAVEATKNIGTKISTDAITVNDQQQFVTAVEKNKWNTVSKFKPSFNIGLRQIDSLTIQPYINIKEYSDWDMKQLAFIPGETIMVVYNTDYQKLYFRTEKITWRQLWSDDLKK